MNATMGRGKKRRRMRETEEDDEEAHAPPLNINYQQTQPMMFPQSTASIPDPYSNRFSSPTKDEEMVGSSTVFKGNDSSP